MAKASAQITLHYVIDVKATYRYYRLQSSTLSAPSKPTEYPPSSDWNDTEPSYTSGSTNSLYFVDCTIFADDSFSYSEVSLSSSYEAAKEAYNKAQNAQNTADDAQSDVDNLSNETTQKFAELNVTTEGISSEVIKQTTRMNQMEESISAIQQTAEGVSIQIQNIIDNGVDKVTTKTGYTFDDDGLKINRSGQEIENLLDNTGMYVTRSGETILQANNKGVIATDVTVRNYLIVGTHSRFEDYGDGRTACFYVGG